MSDNKEFRKNLLNIVSILSDSNERESTLLSIFAYIWLKLIIRKEQFSGRVQFRDNTPTGKKGELTRSEIERLNSDFPGLGVNELMESIDKLSSGHIVLVKSVLEYIDKYVCSLEEANINTEADKIYKLMIEIITNQSRSLPGLISDSVLSMMCDLINFKPGMSVYDPAFGFGRTFKYFVDRYGVDNVKIFGQEIDANICTLTKLVMAFFGLDISSLVCDDTLINPGHLEGFSMAKFDRVICEPPVGTRLSKNELVSDQYMRFVFGISSSSDWAFIEHGISALNDGGKLVSSISNGPLYRGGGDGIIRQNLIKHDLVEAVIQFPKGIIESNKMPVSVIIINKDKPTTVKDSVFMVSLAREDVSDLQSQDFRKPLLEIYQSWKEEQGKSRIVSSKEFERNNFSLLPLDYIIDMPSDKKEAQLIQSISELSNLRIKDVAETYSGTDKRRLKTTDENGDGSKAYLLKISDMEDEGSISIEKAEVIYLSDNVEIDRLKLRQNDILLSARGTIDKVALIKEIPQGINLIASTNLISIRVDPSKYSSNVLFELLRSNYGKFMLTQVSSGGAISGLNVRNIENLKIPVIDGERFSGYRKKTEALQKKIEKLETEIKAYKKAMNEQFHELFRQEK